MPTREQHDGLSRRLKLLLLVLIIVFVALEPIPDVHAGFLPSSLACIDVVIHLLGRRLRFMTVGNCHFDVTEAQTVALLFHKLGPPITSLLVEVSSLGALLLVLLIREVEHGTR